MLAPSNSAISDGGGAFDYGILSSLPNNLPFGMGEVPLPSSALGSSVCTTNGAGWRLQNQSANVNIGNVDRLRDHLPSSCIQGTEVKSGLSVSQGQVRNLGFVGKGTCLSSRFAIDDIELPINDQNDPK
ncbi:hypothetical protein HPP92_023465 [Vanilla planifolia]|nr:hypothetical protein HPP92_023465 [Vanilla planifolia]